MEHIVTLGTTPLYDAPRDAIHIAVMPMVADAIMKPGQRLEHGIVDPFLTSDRHPGERYWLLLYPNTITSLRHEWTHPALDASKSADTSKTTSEKWMRVWAIEHVGEDYYGDGGRVPDDVAYAFAIQAGHKQHIGPYESARDYIDNEWWAHWEAITGQRGDRGSYFSCSC